ncbi:transposase [Nonomuraea polychroma]|uniref:transposase n=1 Tax=Nonomuraea polychroma TaxID=46176 RepID=UPI003D8A230B
MVHSLHAHSLFTAKYRRGVFTDELLRRREQIMIEACNSLGASMIRVHQASTSTCPSWCTTRQGRPARPGQLTQGRPFPGCSARSSWNGEA